MTSCVCQIHGLDLAPAAVIGSTRVATIARDRAALPYRVSERRFRDDDGLYAMIDQTVYREPGKDDEGASAFVRAMASPGDRNLVDLYLDAGIGYRGLLPGRSNDTVGVTLSYARLSSSARGFDRDTILGTGVAIPRRRFEALVEATYQAVLAPGITVQPNLQYVFHPGGNVPDPRDELGRRIKNATVVGLRAMLTY